MAFKKHVVELLDKFTDLSKEEIEKLLEIPPDTSLGDYAFPCFALARILKKSPQEIAQKLVGEIPVKDPIEKITFVGPYVNFFVNKSSFAKQILTQPLVLPNLKMMGLPESVMIEYPSPNTNKPLHFGHVRNMSIGCSISKIYKYLGAKVIQADLVNDRGIHICKSMLAYKKFGENKEPDKKSDHFVGDFYVLYNKKLAEDPNLEKEAQEMLVKWEDGDIETIKLWKKMNKWALDGISKTYKLFGVNHDIVYYESEIYKEGKEIVEDGFERGIFKKDETGATVCPLSQFPGMKDKVLLRSDGTSIYIVQDIFLAKKKFDDFNMQKSVYVVGNEQIYHFQVLFKILEMLEFPFAKDCFHLAHGMVFLPEGRMKSREGTTADADDILDDMYLMSRAEVVKRHKDLEEGEIKKRATQIALGAIKFFLLRTDPKKDMIFNPKESLSFEGETGPYVQYAHARICSILGRLDTEKLATNVDFSVLQDKSEIELIQLLSQFNQMAGEAALGYKPSIVCRYLLDLSQKFNEFYHKCPVLQAESEQLKNARLLLVNKIKEVIKEGLQLLGIDAPEAM
ncbi:arginine--tRNA ligase [Candidatus Woesearchaeota archaeon]|nr:arginine--tRNA ligase [Candidatus Woesearchaeota archaeon]